MARPLPPRRQPAVHDQAAADTLVEDTDHHQVGDGVVDLVDGEHREGVDVVLGYHGDGPAEARVGLEQMVQLVGQRHRMAGPIARKRHDLALIDGRAHFYADSQHPQWRQPAVGPVLVACVLEGCDVLVDQVSCLVPAVGGIVRGAEHARAVQAEQRRCHLLGPLPRLNDLHPGHRVQAAQAKR